jgi:hypothetical protein
MDPAKELGMSVRWSTRSRLGHFLFPLLFGATLPVVAQAAPASQQVADPPAKHREAEAGTLAARRFMPPVEPAAAPGRGSPVIPGDDRLEVAPADANARDDYARQPPPAGERPYLRQLLRKLSLWAMLLLAIPAAAFAIPKSGLFCLLFGHRRSRKRARFTEEQQRWISNCKRCRAPLARDPSGVWLRARGAPVRGDPLAAPAPPASARADPGAPCATDLAAPHPRRPPHIPELKPSAPGPYPSGHAKDCDPDRARNIVDGLLKDVLGGSAAPPGAKAALFSVVDELRSSRGMDEHTELAEKISIKVQQLECALQRRDQGQEKLARGALKQLARQWSSGSPAGDD